MVSFERIHLLSDPNQRKTIPESDNSSSKKRKWEEDHIQLDQQTNFDIEKRSKVEESRSSMFDIELHLETPLPLEWQRCLNVQSGQIHFYNTKTQATSLKDPRKSSETESPSPGEKMKSRLDLELNLTCEPLDLTNQDQYDHFPKQRLVDQLIKKENIFINDQNTTSGVLKRDPSWLVLDDQKQQPQMVATVCNRCFMLVMLCKSSLACPNCKFVHPPPLDHNPSTDPFKSCKL